MRHLRHLEYSHDHVRLEDLLVDGVLTPTSGHMTPGDDRRGLGLQLGTQDVEAYRVA